MSEALLIAILNSVAKIGFQATISILKNRGATVEDAVVALERAERISLQQLKDEDRAGTPPA